MIAVDLLNEDKMKGENKFECLEAYGFNTSATDVAISLGVSTFDLCFAGDGHRASIYWLRDSIANSPCVRAHFVNSNNELRCLPKEYSVGVRPIFSFSSLEDITSTHIKRQDGTIIAENLEYVTKLFANAKDSYKLEQEKRKGTVIPTGKVYTLPNGFEGTLREEKEYFYKGRKIVPFTVSLSGAAGLNGYETLSDGSVVRNGERIWGEVTGLEGFIEGQYFISKQSLFPMQFDSITNHYELSSIKSFLENTFLEELVPSDVSVLLKEEREKGPMLSEKINLILNPRSFSNNHGDSMPKQRSMHPYLQKKIALNWNQKNNPYRR